MHSLRPLLLKNNHFTHSQKLWVQLVEKVQHMLGLLLFLWYNKSGDENVGKES